MVLSKTDLQDEQRCCGPIDRRTWLKVGGLSFGALATCSAPSLARLIAAEGLSKKVDKDFSVILFWANGGPSHVDLFDLKPNAPQEYRGPFSPIRTSVPGMEITELLPRLVKLDDKFTLLRSLHHERNEHSGGTHRFLTGYPSIAANLPKSEYPEIGSIVAKKFADTARDIPLFVGNTPFYGGGPAYLGPAYAPFMPNANLETASGNNRYDPVPIYRTARSADDLSIDRDGTIALNRRKNLLKSLDRLPQAADGALSAVDVFQRQAIDMLASPRTRRAFDLSHEDAGTRDRYGDTHWGKSLLTCRRLVEAGVRFVQCQATFRQQPETGRTSNWDDHSVNSDIFKAYREKLPSFDQSVSAIAMPNNLGNPCHQLPMPPSAHATGRHGKWHLDPMKRIPLKTMTLTTKHTLFLLTALLLVPLGTLHATDTNEFCQLMLATDLPDLALQPAQVITEFGPDHVKSSRGAQGVPAIERAAEGRLWAAWYAGKSKRGVESPSSYVVLATSGDDGANWTEKLVLQAPRLCHTYDPCLWIDPTGKLWFFWAQSAGLQDGRMGVWAMTTQQAGLETPMWSEPRRISNGVMLNKPTALKNGTWLLPVGYWRDNTNVPNITFDEGEIAPYTNAGLAHDLGNERGSNVVASTDQGQSFQRLGQVRIPGTRVDEHMIAERRDGSLWMLLRNTGGIAQSVSTDGGRTWSEGGIHLKGRTFANKRFFLRRLPSGAMLMVRNDSPDGDRSRLTAFVSDDDGLAWSGGLRLDERESSYPDGTIAADGTIRVIYDHQRYTENRAGKKGSGSVMMAVFREEDVRASKMVSDRARWPITISQLQPAD